MAAVEDARDARALLDLRAREASGEAYRTASGAQPVRDWLLEASDQDRRTIGKDIQRLEFEWPVGMPHCRPLGKGLWEVRSRISDGRLGRVIFCVSER